MKMKRYFAADSRQALRELREDQGPDAVILSNRRVDGGVEIIDLDEEEHARFRNAVAPLKERFIAQHEAEGRPAADCIAEMEALAVEYAPLTNAELNERVATQPVMGIIDL